MKRTLALLLAAALCGCPSVALDANFDPANTTITVKLRSLPSITLTAGDGPLAGPGSGRAAPRLHVSIRISELVREHETGLEPARPRCKCAREVIDS